MRKRVKLKMVTVRHNFNIGKNVGSTFPCSQGNGITKEYYNFLVGEINRGKNLQGKAVCKRTIEPFGVEFYHLISIK